MSYEGHVDGSSLPYQFKIPDATETQDGVMTKEQVEKLDSLSPDPPLGGDVVGPASANEIAKIQGVAVDIAGHGAGQVLGFAPGNAQLEPLTLSLAGDAVGALGSNVVQRVQTIPCDFSGHVAGDALGLNAANDGIIARPFPFETSFGRTDFTIATASQQSIGITGLAVGAPANAIDGRILIKGQAVNVMRYAFGSLLPLQVTVQLMLSTNGGASYAALLTHTINAGLKAGSFTGFLASLPLGSMHCVVVNGIVASGSSYTGPFSVTWGFDPFA